MQAERLAAFDRFIDDLPDGLDSMVAQGNSNLSGEQRERLCLARRLLAACVSSMLWSDEPTRALDPLGETAVSEQMDSTFSQACIVASVHRITLLSRFDHVVLMVRRQVMDLGKVTKLQERQPLFREMLDAEASGNVDANAATVLQLTPAPQARVA